MGQGSVMDLDERIELELRQLRVEKPEHYGLVERELRGFREDLDDYVVEIRRGAQAWQVVTAEDWTRLKRTLETTPVVHRTDPPPIPVEKPTSPRGRTKTTAREPGALARDDEDWSWLHRARPKGPSVGHARGRIPARRVRRSQRATPTVSAARQHQVPTRLPTSLDGADLNPDAIIWRQQVRPGMLACIEQDVEAWLAKAPGGPAAWRLTHMTTPRPPERRPDWAGDHDSYLLLVHGPSGLAWELDLLEQWYALERKLPGRFPAALGRPSPNDEQESEPGTSVVTSLVAEPRPSGHATRVPAATREYAECPRCGARLRRDRIRRHESRCPAATREDRTKTGRTVGRDVHQPADVALPSGPRHQSGLVRGTSPIRDNAPPEDLGHEDPRDASRRWGCLFRDHGLFGSYPVHDRYDDEGEP